MVKPGAAVIDVGINRIAPKNLLAMLIFQRWKLLPEQLHRCQVASDS